MNNTEHFLLRMSLFIGTALSVYVSGLQLLATTGMVDYWASCKREGVNG